MIVVDTSAFISLTAAQSLDLFFEEFDVHTTETVVEELEDLSGYSDGDADRARQVLNQQHRCTIHEVDTPDFRSTRIDEGEGSYVQLTRNTDADFLITDDLRALPELQTLTETRIVISPLILKSLDKRGVLGREKAVEKLDRAAAERDWLNAPIYRKARELFEQGS